MKKIVLAILILAFGSISIAKEQVEAMLEPDSSYIILLEKPASSVISTKDSVASAEILATIFNEKNQVILSSLEEGNAKIFIDCEDDVAILDINVNDNNTLSEVSNTKIIKAIIKIDTPFKAPSKKEKLND